MKKIINVSIVEDSANLRRTLKRLIADVPDLNLVSAYGKAEEALARLPDDKPDVVLMDIRMPGMNGIECVALLVECMPDVRVVMWTAYEDSDEIFASLAAGAHGYLLKSAEPEKLLDSIREVAVGGSPISGSVARQIVGFFRSKPPVSGSVASLAPREQEVLKLLADGCPYKQIASTMDVSIGTVRTYIERIYEKLHVHSRTEAVVQYLDQGRYRPSDPR
ncbi:MAG: DNA-binding NarL/FixJ family response regulator [Candidatus Promineifilaceae bacterium]